MITLHNAQFTCEINELGAEVTTLVRRSDGRPYIWDDTEDRYWPRHAPVLFPAIGKSNQDAYLLAGNQYPMRLHGIARDYPFTAIQLTPDQVTMTQEATAETLAFFPFHYKLQIIYTLTATGLTTDFIITNQDDQTMPFALGSHPGIPLTQPLDHYTLTLVDASAPLTMFEMGPLPFRTGATLPFAASATNQVPLSYDLLDPGSITFDAADATAAVLTSVDGDHQVTISLRDFPYLTVWTPEHKNAPFVCVEPFAGLPDVAGEPGDWHQKPGNQLLAAKQSRRYSYTMTLA